MSKKFRRHSLRTYFKLTLGAVLLVGLNYVFTKLFDLLYGKFDAGYFIGVAILFFVFIGIFTLYISVADSSGSLARMMGARDNDK